MGFYWLVSCWATSKFLCNWVYFALYFFGFGFLVCDAVGLKQIAWVHAGCHFFSFLRSNVLCLVPYFGGLHWATSVCLGTSFLVWLNRNYSWFIIIEFLQGYLHNIDTT